DDLAGDKRIKGLINHVRSTLKSNMTTGFLKALIGFLAACTISIRTAGSLAELAADVLVITLSANAINLFDMRPGRAVKVFLAISLMILSSSAGRPAEALPLIILVMTVLIYMSYDLREICMLGDTGANILGISLGYYSTLFLSFSSKLMLLVLLILLNIAAERLSITALISKSRILSYLDSLGRRRTDNR
ncbi:MAG TPA: UDP-N-acetylmuramyl pentapeptide phosphotransferase, partial [Bacillota bacterium]|nr:UDP-N-acetylmuramyl pentapeptide phosphotransferase [Bacillota bacterium]